MGLSRSAPKRDECPLYICLLLLLSWNSPCAHHCSFSFPSSRFLPWPSQSKAKRRSSMVTLSRSRGRVRLHGIDAPESGQRCQDERGRDFRCGRRSAFALADWIGRANVSCEQRDTDRYGRVVAVCRVQGADMNHWMVREGWAVAYREYSPEYVSDELAAQRARAGLWAGRFIPPSEWRRGQR